nr:glycine--tRNA ligase subunit beta [Terricaulis sp.]
ADAALVARAAELAKMDLVTETVGEFPELQGQIGRQLAAFDGEPESVAIAVEDHYRPLGPNDRVPKDTVAVTLALADKLDTLAAFWKIDEKPTGSSDPYALRRAALGAVRIVVANEKTVNLHYVLDRHLETQFGLPVASASGLALEVVYFIHDRLRVQLRDAGKRHDLLDAVLENASSATEWPLTLIVARVEALDAFLKTEDGANLLAGYKRAANILIAEEKKGKGLSESDLAAGLDASKLTEPAEKSLHAALESALPTARSAVEKEDFAGAMKALSALRAPVDAFFDQVMVNADDPMLRRNRLLLLSRLREALSQVADFSKIEG